MRLGASANRGVGRFVSWTTQLSLLLPPQLRILRLQAGSRMPEVGAPDTRASKEGVMKADRAPVNGKAIEDRLQCCLARVETTFPRRASIDRAKVSER